MQLCLVLELLPEDSKRFPDADIGYAPAFDTAPSLSSINVRRPLFAVWQ